MAWRRICPLTARPRPMAAGSRVSIPSVADGLQEAWHRADQEPAYTLLLERPETLQYGAEGARA
jgi:hypothetical protein